jgi:MFS family permease
MDYKNTDIPARLDSLRWGRFHTLVVVALGVSWILDGLEVTLAGAVAGALQASDIMRFKESQIGAAASAYLAGAVLGALLFGWLTDRWGRRRLFFITLAVYLLGTLATAFATNFWTFALCRAVTGAGIGGEYAAINSAIQELIPARYRGRTDLAINGSFWVGAALGAIGAVVLLEPGRFPADLGWRLAFGIGAVLGAVVLMMRRLLPESPRWLLIQGRVTEAQAVMQHIEANSSREPGSTLRSLQLRARPGVHGFIDLARCLVRQYPRRTALGLILMSAQAFCYNAIFFTYALVLGRFFAVPPESVGLYLLPFAISNFLGPLILGRWFDTIGRRVMISFTFGMSGLLLAVTAWLFVNGMLDARTQTMAWCAVFFFASAAASSAYLTVSESFPLEVRALTIAFFYAVGTALGGIAAPWLFGSLIGTGEPSAIAGGYLLGAGLMLVAGVAALWLGIDAERRSLEDIAPPLSTFEDIAPPLATATVERSAAP